MFCLRSWLPLLFIPTSASPAFIVLFLISTYLFHRPCIYCSLIMLTLFSSSCYWGDRCFFDTNDGAWFEPRVTASEWSGIGLGWLRVLLGVGSGGAAGIGGRREWRLPCVDVAVRV